MIVLGRLKSLTLNRLFREREQLKCVNLNNNINVVDKQLLIYKRGNK